MVQYRDLNAPPSRMLADVIADMKAQGRQSKTGDAGVKDLGEAGDVVWPRPDGTPVSVRDVDLDLADARQRIEDAEGALGETGTRLTAAEQAVQDVRDDLAAIEVGGGGPLIHDHIPAPADGEGKPAGTAWLVYGADGALTSVWQWDGTAWEEMPLDATLIPVIDIGSGTFGDLEGSRLTVNDLLAARVVQAMDLETKKLVVTEEAILNHATLIGQTVVDDINVQGKLIGKDGVFTGTVDFENVNVTDQVLASRVSGEHIYGTVVEGGEIRTTDGLPGQVILSDEGYVDPAGGVKFPGIRIIPVDASKLVTPPGMGPNSNGFVITGGRNLTGGRGFSIYEPAQAVMGFQKGNADSKVAVGDGYAWVTTHDGNSNRGEILARPTFSHVKATAADGTVGMIQATPSTALVGTYDPSGNYMSQIKSNGREAYLWSTGSDGLGRVLSVDSDGVWVKAQRGDGSGLWDHYNLTKTASDSDWIYFNAHTGISTGASPALRLKGGIVWAQGYVTRPAGWAAGWTRVAGSFATWLRPTRDILRYGATTATQRQLVRMTSTGYLEVWWSAAAPGDYQVDLSVLSYPNT